MSLLVAAPPWEDPSSGAYLWREEPTPLTTELWLPRNVFHDLHLRDWARALEYLNTLPTHHAAAIDIASAAATTSLGHHSIKPFRCSPPIARETAAIVASMLRPWLHGARASRDD